METILATMGDQLGQMLVILGAALAVGFAGSGSAWGIGLANEAAEARRAANMHIHSSAPGTYSPVGCMPLIQSASVSSCVPRPNCAAVVSQKRGGILSSNVRCISTGLYVSILLEFLSRCCSTDCIFLASRLEQHRIPRNALTLSRVRYSRIGCTGRSATDIACSQNLCRL